MNNIYLVKENFNPIALRTAKTLWSFGHSECNRIKSTCGGSGAVVYMSILERRAQHDLCLR